MTPEGSKLIDEMTKILSGISRTMKDPAVPDFDKELLKNYLKDWFK